MSTAHLHKPVRQVDGFSLFFQNDIAVIVMDRGENRLNNNFFTGLNTLLDDVERNKACKGLVTTGVGKFYSNGADLDWVTTLTEEEIEKFVFAFVSTTKRILCFPVPTLAAVNGHAFAGGAVLAFAHDLRIMNANKGWLCVNEVLIGVSIPAFLVAYLSAKVGSGRNLSDVIVLGRRYNAQEALTNSLIHAAIPEGALIPQAFKHIHSINGKDGYPRQSMVNMKQDVYSTALKVFEKHKLQMEAMKSKL